MYSKHALGIVDNEMRLQSQIRSILNLWNLDTILGDPVVLILRYLLHITYFRG